MASLLLPWAKMYGAANLASGHLDKEQRKVLVGLLVVDDGTISEAMRDTNKLATTWVDVFKREYTAQQGMATLACALDSMTGSFAGSARNKVLSTCFEGPAYCKDLWNDVPPVYKERCCIMKIINALTTSEIGTLLHSLDASPTLSENRNELVCYICYRHSKSRALLVELVVGVATHSQKAAELGAELCSHYVAAHSTVATSSSTTKPPVVVVVETGPTISDTAPITVTAVSSIATKAPDATRDDMHTVARDNIITKTVTRTEFVDFVIYVMTRATRKVGKILFGLLNVEVWHADALLSEMKERACIDPWLEEFGASSESMIHGMAVIHRALSTLREVELLKQIADKILWLADVVLPLKHRVVCEVLTLLYRPGTTDRRVVVTNLSLDCQRDSTDFALIFSCVVEKLYTKPDATVRCICDSLVGNQQPSYAWLRERNFDPSLFAAAPIAVVSSSSSVSRVLPAIKEENAPLASDKTEECCVCLVNKRTLVGIPCMHVALCVPCYHELCGTSKSNAKCPVCRCELTDAMQVWI